MILCKKIGRGDKRTGKRRGIGRDKEVGEKARGEAKRLKVISYSNRAKRVVIDLCKMLTLDLMYGIERPLFRSA
jgi:hypothetical protein